MVENLEKRAEEEAINLIKQTIHTTNT